MRALLCIFAIIACAAAIAPLHLHKEPIADSYIVVFKSMITEQLVGSHLENLRMSMNITYEYTYQNVLKGFSATLLNTQLAKLRAHPSVDYVEQNGMYHLACKTQTDDGIWGLSRISKRHVQLDNKYDYPDIAGAGVDAYIFDTGIRITHEEFEGRAFFDYKATQSWPSTDDNGHGTHVASTVAGVTYGVAKKANLYAYKVLSGAGSGSTSGIINAITVAVSNVATRKRPATGNMSLGGSYSLSLNNAVSGASSKGLLMVVAAGNSDTDACNESPASADNVFSVGATDVALKGGAEKDVRSYFSNYGSCVNVFAPGSQITGAWYTSNTAINTISGTSMASPHVCGGVALYLAENPTSSFNAALVGLSNAGTKNAIDLECAAGDTGCTQSPNLLLYVGCQ